MPELFAKLLSLPLGYFLVVIAVIFLLVAAVGKFKELIDPGKPGRIFSGVIGIPLLIIGLVLSFGFPSITAGTVTNIPPPNITATPTSSSSPLNPLTVNRQLVCASNCDTSDPIASHSIAVQITVISFTFDTAQKQTSMLLLLEPQHSESNCSFGLGNGFSIQDATGKTYLPGGQLKDGGSFSLVQGQQQRLVATYAFIPSAGSTYTLRPLEINCDNHSIGYTPTYGDTQFTF